MACILCILFSSVFLLKVDYILTPTQLIKCEGGRSKPAHITWSKLTRNHLRKHPILRTLIKKEREDGKDVTLMKVPRVQRSPPKEPQNHAEEQEETEERAPRQGRGRGRGQRGYGRRGFGRNRRRQQSEQSGDESREHYDQDAGLKPVLICIFTLLERDILCEAR